MRNINQHNSGYYGHNYPDPTYARGNREATRAYNGSPHPGFTTSFYGQEELANHFAADEPATPSAFSGSFYGATEPVACEKGWTAVQYALQRCLLS